MGRHRRPEGRAARWLRRYGPAECAGVLAALTVAAATYPFGVVTAAFAAALAESIGFYAVVVVRDLRTRRASTVRTVRDLLVEFGPAEALDSLLVRPLAMYLAVAATGALGTGVMLGKVVADVAFYAVAIIGHELIRARR